MLTSAPIIPLMIYIYNVFSTPVAVVGLERIFYQVPEGVGVVEVCTLVYNPNSNSPCPINFAFDVSLTSSDRFSTSDGSADVGSAGDEH